MNRNRARSIFEQAVARLRANDLLLQTPDGFPRTIGERPLTFRLALYIIEGGAEDGGLKVDCDYNRRGTSIKELLPAKAEPGMPSDMPTEEKPKRFFPDLVLHRRGDNERNILVCEVKRRGDHRDPEVDRGRLIELTR